MQSLISVADFGYGASVKRKTSTSRSTRNYSQIPIFSASCPTVFSSLTAKASVVLLPPFGLSQYEFAVLHFFSAVGKNCVCPFAFPTAGPVPGT